MKEYKDPEVLTELYREKNMSRREIADKFDVSHGAIQYWINKHEIEKGKAEYKKSEVLTKLYHEKEMSLREISDKFDVSTPTIQRWMKKHNIERRESKREKPPCYTKNYDGYKVWKHRDGSGKKQMVLVHRLLAVNEFGFDAVSDKIVHHKNGCRFDNRPENIEVMTQSEHINLHHEKGHME